jgi:hypothetical protein
MAESSRARQNPQSDGRCVSAAGHSVIENCCEISRFATFLVLDSWMAQIE